METHKKLNIASIIILLILGLYVFLVVNDNPISWKISES